METPTYQQILANSPSYKSLPPEDQEKVLTADGEQRKTYLKIYEDEAKLILQASKEYFQNNERIIIELNYSVKKNTHRVNKRSEIVSIAKDLASVEDLLKNI